MTFISYPKTVQFKDVITRVRSAAKFNGVSVGKLVYWGTVKLHGTNAAVVFDKQNKYHFQSRKRIITPTDDNAGFAFAMEGNNTKFVLEKVVNPIRKKYAHYGTVAVYGEWCGGNIQSGVAITGAAKMFVIFKILLLNQDGTEKWVRPLDFEDGIDVKNIYNYETYRVTIDFNVPAATQNLLVDITNKVEDQCPFGKEYNREGVGEGVVWAPENEKMFQDSQYTFKVKGHKHSDSRVKVLAEVDPEKVKSLTEFTDNVLTEVRLNKGIDHLRECGLNIGRGSTGIYLKWIVTDIVEEEIDVMQASGIEVKDVTKRISIKARNWFFDYLDNLDTGCDCAI